MLSHAFVPLSQPLHAPADSTNTAHLQGLMAQGDLSEPSQNAQPSLRLLLVDTDSNLRSECAAAAAEMGFEPVSAATAGEAYRAFCQHAADLLLLDLHLPDDASLDLLAEIRDRKPDTVVIVTTANATVSSAVEAMRLGACDYLTKPFTQEALAEVLQRAAQRVQVDHRSRFLRDRLQTNHGMGRLIGRTPEMEKVYRIISKVAFSAHPVLIFGESGTGKELVARSIHGEGPNASRPFVAVDVSAIDPARIESELFGEGVGGEVDRPKEGLLCNRNGGTLFLEEVGELSLEVQARLHRSLLEKQVRFAGSAASTPLSVRILAASSRDLAGMVEQGRFRRDLFFRLNVVNIKLPALRNRRDDIRMLAEFFLERNEAQTVAHAFSADAIRAMEQYDWPGNVRELEHAVERACALSSGPVLHMADLPTQLQDFRMHVFTEAAAAPDPRSNPILSMADHERHAIIDAIRRFRGDKLKAASALGIGKTTLYRKLKEYGILPAEIRRA